MIIVTGPIRSGSSLLTEILHSLGVPMGESMLFPLIGSYPEFEDSNITKTVIDAAYNDKVVPVKVFRQFIKERQSHFEEVKKVTNPDILQDTWGLKCPPILLFSRNLEKAAADCGETVKWVYTSRPKEESRAAFVDNANIYIHPDIRESMIKIFDKTQDKIYTALDQIKDEKFIKAEFENDIPGTVKKLTDKLGLKQVFE